jgi:hypothetical protein
MPLRLLSIPQLVAPALVARDLTLKPLRDGVVRTDQVGIRRHPATTVYAPAMDLRRPLLTWDDALRHKHQCLPPHTRVDPRLNRHLPLELSSGQLIITADQQVAVTLAVPHPAVHHALHHR